LLLLIDFSHLQVDDLERPLVADDCSQLPSQGNGPVKHAAEGFQTEGMLLFLCYALIYKSSCFWSGMVIS